VIHMKYLIGLLVFAVFTGIDTQPFVKMIESDPEIVVTMLMNFREGKTFAYTVSKERFSQLPIWNQGEDVPISIGQATKVAFDEAVRSLPEVQSNLFRLVNISLINQKLPRRDEKIWLYSVDFHAGAPETETGVVSEDMDYANNVRIFVLMDGKVILPRITPYTKYIDEHRTTELSQRHGRTSLNGSLSPAFIGLPTPVRTIFLPRWQYLIAGGLAFVCLIVLLCLAARNWRCSRKEHSNEKG